MAKKSAKKAAPKKAAKKKSVKKAVKASAAKVKAKASKPKTAKPAKATLSDREKMLRERASDIASRFFHAGQSAGAAAKAIGDEGIKLAEKLPSFVENVYAMSKKRVGEGMDWVAKNVPSPMGKPKKSARKK